MKNDIWVYDGQNSEGHKYFHEVKIVKLKESSKEEKQQTPPPKPVQPAQRPSRPMGEGKVIEAGH